MISDVHRLGCGLSVQFSRHPDYIRAQWTPRTPTVDEFRRIQPAYREARDQFLRAVAAAIGGPVLVVEV